MRVRELEEEGWTIAFTEGSGLKDKVAGGFCTNPNRVDTERQLEMTGNEYLGIRATHFNGELEGIALVMGKHIEADTQLLAILTDSKPAIQTLEKLDSEIEGPCSEIEARIQASLEDWKDRHMDTYIT